MTTPVTLADGRDGALSGRTRTVRDVTLRAVAVIIGVVVGLTFLFGLGNVLGLGLRLGVPIWVAPLVGPAVDRSVLGLLVAARHLALAGVPAAGLRPAQAVDVRQRRDFGVECGGPANGR